MKRVIPKIIDSSQSSFIEGRGLLDCILAANKVVEECKGQRGEL